MDSLDAIASGKNIITHIMEAAHVNCSTLKKMLYIAVERREIEEKNGTYTLSEKGLALVNEWKPYNEFSKRIDLFK